MIIIVVDENMFLSDGIKKLQKSSQAYVLEWLTRYVSGSIPKGCRFESCRTHFFSFSTDYYYSTHALAPVPLFAARRLSVLEVVFYDFPWPYILIIDLFLFNRNIYQRI